MKKLIFTLIFLSILNFPAVMTEVSATTSEMTVSSESEGGEVTVESLGGKFRLHNNTNRRVFIRYTIEGLKSGNKWDVIKNDTFYLYGRTYADLPYPQNSKYSKYHINYTWEYR